MTYEGPEGAVPFQGLRIPSLPLVNTWKKREVRVKIVYGIEPFFSQLGREARLSSLLYIHLDAVTHETSGLFGDSIHTHIRSRGRTHTGTPSHNTHLRVT